MKLTFHGGAGTVTGSNYLLEIGDPSTSSGSTRTLRILVDCGLIQGSHFAEKQNFKSFPYDPREIKAVFVTHAHIDHIGRIPKLFRDGFRGEIYSTEPTKDFAELMLLDSEHILSQEAERERCPNICTAEDVKAVMKLWRGVRYHEVIEVGGLKAAFFDAGHILGSAFIKVAASERRASPARSGREAGDKTVVFSGDLGNYPAPIIEPAETLDSADYCVIESTYGGRVHEEVEKRQEFLEDAIEDTIRSGGTLMIPAFAMERTQDLLFHINQLVEGGRIPKAPVYIDSPLAIHLTEIYKKYSDYFNEEARKLIRSGEDILNFPGLHLSLTTEQSKEINNAKPPKIIIAGSGMSHGGRILHHELRYLSDPKSTILFIGYQTAGSLGRQILDGAKIVKIFGEEVPVRCKVRVIAGYSAHADQPRLLNWLKYMRFTLKEVFVVQGETGASEILAAKIRDDLAVEAVVPKQAEEFVL